MNSDEIFYDVYVQIKNEIYNDLKYLFEHKYTILNNIKSSTINCFSILRLYIKSIPVYILVIIGNINNDINIIREKNPKISLCTITEYYDQCSEQKIAQFNNPLFKAKK